MILQELYDPAIKDLQDLEDDSSKQEYGNVRKTRLTLRQLSKLRRMLELRQNEYQDKLTQIKAQYSASSSSDSGGLGI